jgi:hypothetical protein
VLAILTGLALAARISWDARDFFGTVWSHLRDNRRARWTCIVLMGLLIAAIALVQRYLQQPDTEPWYWTEGISIWPSEILRLLAAVSAWTLLYLGWTRMTNAEVKGSDPNVQKEFCLPKPADSDAAHSWRIHKTIHAWRSHSKGTDQHASTVDVAELWREYAHMGTMSRRVVRSGINLFFFVIFFSVLSILLGFPQMAIRGEIAQAADKIITLLGAMSAMFLTMFIVDGARLCDRMIARLEEGRSVWPSDAKLKFAKKQALPDAWAAEWMDVEFIASRTTLVQQLIWYPVIPYLLMILARNSVFDDWNFPLSLIVVVGLSLLYAFSCAFLLQARAKEARRKAVGILTMELDKLRGDTNAVPQRIAQLEELIRRIVAMRDGAFQPIVEQPLFKALLTLLGGGGLALTDLLGGLW